MCQRECELLRRMALERGKREKGRKPTRGGGVYWRDWRDRYLLFVLTNNGRACARHQPHVGQRIDRVAARGRGSPEEPQVDRAPDKTTDRPWFPSIRVRVGSQPSYKRGRGEARYAGVGTGSTGSRSVVVGFRDAVVMVMRMARMGSCLHCPGAAGRGVVRGPFDRIRDISSGGIVWTDSASVTDGPYAAARGAARVTAPSQSSGRGSAPART